jgi:hypothetical protein
LVPPAKGTDIGRLDLKSGRVIGVFASGVDTGVSFGIDRCASIRGGV